MASRLKSIVMVNLLRLYFLILILRIRLERLRKRNSELKEIYPKLVYLVVINSRPVVASSLLSVKENSMLNRYIKVSTVLSCLCVLVLLLLAMSLWIDPGLMHLRGSIYASTMTDLAKKLWQTLPSFSTITGYFR